MLQKLSAFIFLILIFILSWVTNVSAQQSIRFKHLTDKNGLSQNSVMCIFQDKKGFMWFGTQDGLNRFDGYSFKVFRNDPANPHSLAGNFIRSIHEDSAGTLYFETISGIVQRYNPSDENFTTIPSDSINLSKMKGNAVIPSLQSPSGIRWEASGRSGKGLMAYNTISGDTTWYKHNPSDPSSISDDKVYCVYRDHRGNIWIGTYNGLDKFDKKTGGFIHYRHNNKNPFSISDNFVWSIFQDKSGTMWIGTDNGGLNKFNVKAGRFYSYKNDPKNSSSISDNFIFSIYQDRSGIIWIGTSDGGINYFAPSENNFKLFKHIPGNGNSLSSSFIRGISISKPNIAWIGTNRSGLNWFDEAIGRFSIYKHDALNPESIASNNINTVYTGPEGYVWVGTLKSGLDRLNPKTGKFKHYVHNASNSNSLSNNWIYAICADKEGYIWVGTNAGGLNRLNPMTGVFKSYQYSKSDTTGIGSNSIWSLLPDSNGTLWIGTNGAGLEKMNTVKGTFIKYLHNDADTSSISGNIVVSLCKAKDGTIWAGTTSGLSELKPKSGTFKSYYQKEGLSNDMIFGIEEDNNGNIWVSTNKGISKLNPHTEKIKNYNYNDGLQADEFNQFAYAKDKKTGEIYFGGVNGLNIFQPDNIKNNTYIPPIVFTGFKLYNTDNKEGKPIYETGISVKKNLKLNYKDNILNFDFSALNYYNTASNEYTYKLEGFNKNWIHLGNTHTVTFTNLSPGKYTLHVRGSNNDGVWNMDGASLSIIITPPWWKTKYAYGFYIVFFIGLLYGARRFELNRREEKAQMRESELRVKATEAEKRALTAENERKTKELEEARKLQLSMLPQEIPLPEEFEIAVFMRTATEVGGDYYDFNCEEDGTLNIAFGDATGHGMQAGTMVTLIKGFFLSLSAKLNPESFMKHCTRAIKEIKLGRILMAFTLIKIKEAQLVISAGGMPPIYHYKKKDKTVEEIIFRGMPLGAMSSFPYTSGNYKMESGDTLLLITDGLPEQMNSNGEMYDYPRVCDKFASIAEKMPKQIIDELVTSCDEWMKDTQQSDDITVMVIRKH